MRLILDTILKPIIALQYVEIIERRQRLKIACLEEVARRKGWVTGQVLLKKAEVKKTLVTQSQPRTFDLQSSTQNIIV